MGITSLTRHIFEIMVSKFSNIMININKVIDNRSTFFSGGVTLCTENMKYFCYLSVSFTLTYNSWPVFVPNMLNSHTTNPHPPFLINTLIHAFSGREQFKQYINSIPKWGNKETTFDYSLCRVWGISPSLHIKEHFMKT